MRPNRSHDRHFLIIKITHIFSSYLFYNYYYKYIMIIIRCWAVLAGAPSPSTVVSYFRRTKMLYIYSHIEGNLWCDKILFKSELFSWYDRNLVEKSTKWSVGMKWWGKLPNINFHMYFISSLVEFYQSMVLMLHFVKENAFQILTLFSYEFLSRKMHIKT